MTLEEANKIILKVYKNRLETSSPLFKESLTNVLSSIKTGSYKDEKWADKVFELRPYVLRTDKNKEKEKKRKKRREQSKESKQKRVDKLLNSIYCLSWEDTSLYHQSEDKITNSGLWHFDINDIRINHLAIIKETVINFKGVFAAWENLNNGISFLGHIIAPNSYEETYHHIADEFDTHISKTRLLDSDGKYYSCNKSFAESSNLKVLSFDENLLVRFDKQPWILNFKTRTREDFTRNIKYETGDGNEVFWEFGLKSTLEWLRKKEKRFVGGRPVPFMSSLSGLCNNFGVDKEYLKERWKQILTNQKINQLDVWNECNTIIDDNYRRYKHQFGKFLYTSFTNDVQNWDISFQLLKGEYVSDLHKYPKFSNFIKGNHKILIKSDTGSGKTRAFIGEDSPFEHIIMASPVKVIGDQNMTQYEAGIYNEDSKEIKKKTTTTYNSLIKCIYDYGLKFGPTPLVVVLDEIHKIIEEYISDKSSALLSDLAKMKVHKIIAISATPIYIESVFDDYKTLKIESILKYKQYFHTFFSKGMSYADHLQWFLDNKKINDDDFLMIRVNRTDPLVGKLASIKNVIVKKFGEENVLLFNSKTKNLKDVIELTKTTLITDNLKCIIFTDTISNGANFYFKDGCERHTHIIDYENGGVRNVKQFSNRIRNQKSVTVWKKNAFITDKEHSIYEINDDINFIKNYAVDGALLEIDKYEKRLSNAFNMRDFNLSHVTRIDNTKRILIIDNDGSLSFNHLGFTKMVDDINTREGEIYPVKFIYGLIKEGFEFLGNETHKLDVLGMSERALKLKESEERKIREIEEDVKNIKSKKYNKVVHLIDVSFFVRSLKKRTNNDDAFILNILDSIVYSKKKVIKIALIKRELNNWKKRYAYQYNNEVLNCDINRFYKEVKVGQEYTMEELNSIRLKYRLNYLDVKPIAEIQYFINFMFETKKHRRTKRGVSKVTYEIVNKNPFKFELKTAEITTEISMENLTLERLFNLKF